MNVLNEKKSFQNLASGPVQKAGEPAWLTDLRKKSFEQFQSQGFPSRRHEAWKYIYLDTLLNRGVSLAQKTHMELPREVKSFSNRIVYLNGSLLSEESPALKHSYITTDTARIDWARNDLAHSETPETNPFVFLNTSQFQDGLFLRIPKEISIEEPLHVFFISAGSNQTSPVFYPRILVSAETGSKFEIILHHLGLNPEFYFMNSVLEFVLAPNANVYCFLSQHEKDQAIQFLNMRARLMEGSRLEIVSTSQGGSILRNDILANLDGADSYAAFSGLTLLRDRTQVFQHVNVNHRILNCTSRQNYKNILADHATAEFNSMVHVWRCAQKSDSEQLDKNLLLSENARIYSRPQLKIDNDDVRANHGAATGQLDEKELFYLRSRGLDSDEARFLLMKGFAAEILEKIKPEAVRRSEQKKIEEKIFALAESLKGSA